MNHSEKRNVQDGVAKFVIERVSLSAIRESPESVESYCIVPDRRSVGAASVRSLILFDLPSRNEQIRWG